MGNQRRLQRGVVKQLSNLSIDEISTVDRGANQHALISIAKRAPEADDYFGVDKGFGHFVERGVMGAARAGAKVGDAVRGEASNQFNTAHKLRQLNPGHLTGNLHEAAGHTLDFAADHPAATTFGAVVGGTEAKNQGKVIHNHYYGGKRAPEEIEKNLDVDALFDISKKKSSFGQGGQQAVIDEFSGDDPSGVTDDENGEKGNVGPGGKIDGVETIQGEDIPPKKAKKKSKGDVNPSSLSGLGKSADFWKNVVSKVLDGEEFETTDEDDDENVGKHFPGPPGAGGFGAQNPAQSPFPGAAGPGMAPQMQTPGVQPMGMGQPTPPPNGGMPAQLPPDVVQYIQQLEQALDQLTGGDDGDGGDQSQNQQTSQSNGSDSSGDDKKNPFGKSLETSDMDETTFLTELAKSLDDDDERDAVNKALETVAKAEYRAKQAEQIAKAERDLRLEREFIAKAAEFNLPVKSSDLGPVLKRAAEGLDEEDFKTIVKCLRAVSASTDYGNPYGEVGKRGGGDNADIMTEVEHRAQELVGKAANMTPEAATLQVLSDNPAAYDEYLRDKRSRQF